MKLWKKFSLIFISAMLLSLVTAVCAVSPPENSNAIGSIDVSEYKEYYGGYGLINKSLCEIEPFAETIGYLKEDNALIFGEYEEYDTVRIPIDDHTFQIVTQAGEVIATYSTDDSDTVDFPAKVRSSAWRFDWTVKSGKQTAGNDRLSSYAGFKISFVMEFSTPGASKIGVAAHDRQAVYWIYDESDTCSGTMTFNENIGLVSLAIRNDSDHTITYSGAYTI